MVTKPAFVDIWFFNMQWKLWFGEHNGHQTCIWWHLIFQYAMKNTVWWTQSSPNLHLETSDFSICNENYSLVDIKFTKPEFGDIWFFNMQWQLCFDKRIQWQSLKIKRKHDNNLLDAPSRMHISLNIVIKHGRSTYGVILLEHYFVCTCTSSLNKNLIIRSLHASWFPTHHAEVGASDHATIGLPLPAVIDVTLQKVDSTCKRGFETRSHIGGVHCAHGHQLSHTHEMQFSFASHATCCPLLSGEQILVQLWNTRHNGLVWFPCSSTGTL